MILLVGAIVILLFFSLAYARRKVERKLYQPIKKHITLSNIVYRDIYISTRTGAWSLGKKRHRGDHINVWYFNKWKKGKVLLYFHGNCYNISYREYMIRLCDLMGINILLVDYRGYGRSDGKASSQNILRDAKMAMRFLIEERDVRDVYVWGESLGGVPACYIASKYSKIGGLILFSTFASFHRVLEEANGLTRYLLYSLAKVITQDIDHHTNNLAMISRVKSPILILHSKDDTLIPYSNAKDLFEAIPHGKKRISTIYGDHDDPEVTLDNIEDITIFLGVKANKDSLEEMQKIVNSLNFPDDVVKR